jgi:hypothetical protein
MIDGDMDEHYTLLYQQNEELELMLQTQSDQIEKLQQQLALEKRKVRELRYAGRRMSGFIDEMIMNDVFHDEVLDEAEKASSRWQAVMELMSTKRSRK